MTNNMIKLLKKILKKESILRQSDVLKNKTSLLQIARKNTMYFSFKIQ